MDFRQEKGKAKENLGRICAQSDSRIPVTGLITCLNKEIYIKSFDYFSFILSLVRYYS